jgi:hypothetical protein
VGVYTLLPPKVGEFFYYTSNEKLPKKLTFVMVITNPTTISKVIILAHDGLICISQI